MRRYAGARRGLRALLLVSLAFGGLAVASAPADAAKPPTPKQLGATWLANQITANGGYLAPFGGPDIPNTAYAVLALHAAHTGQAASDSAIAFLKTKLGAELQAEGKDFPGALAYDIMAAVAAGQSPTQFGGTGATNNLVARLLATQRTSGTDAGLFGTQFPDYDAATRQGLALAAMKAANVADTDSHVVAGLQWLTKQQCANGLFMSYRPDTTVACPPADPNFFTGPDTNSTGVAFQGLAAWGQKPNRKTAIASLQAVQTTDGGFSFMAAPGLSSDPNSTALVIQGLKSWGSSPKGLAWQRPGGNPLSALQSFQLTCDSDPANAGAFVYPGISGPNMLATIQAVPAMALQKFPLRASVKIRAPFGPCTTSTGACKGNIGVTVFVDMTSFGKGTKTVCTTSAPATGLDALHVTGFTTEGTANFGDAFVCRISNLPTRYKEKCLTTPPGNAHWSYYHANSGATTWTVSAVGASSYHPAQGSVEAWAFGSNAQPSMTPTQVRGS